LVQILQEILWVTEVSRYEMELNEHELNKYLVKKSEIRALKLHESKKGFENSKINDMVMKKLALTLQSTDKLQRLHISCAL